VTQMILMEFMMKVYPLHTYGKHPLANLPHMLNAMRVQRKLAAVKRRQEDHVASGGRSVTEMGSVTV